MRFQSLFAISMLALLPVLIAAPLMAQVAAAPADAGDPAARAFVEKLANDAFAPISNRFSVAMSKFKNAA